MRLTASTVWFLEPAAAAVTSDSGDFPITAVSYPYLGGFLIVAVALW